MCQVTTGRGTLGVGKLRPQSRRRCLCRTRQELRDWKETLDEDQIRIGVFGSKSLAILESEVQGATASYNVFCNDKLATTISFPPSRRTDFADSLKELHASLQKKTLPNANLDTALRHLRVIEACYQSMSENRGVELDSL